VAARPAGSAPAVFAEVDLSSITIVRTASDCAAIARSIATRAPARVASAENSAPSAARLRGRSSRARSRPPCPPEASPEASPDDATRAARTSRPPTASYDDT
jgi:hypothetical protein